MSPLTKLLGDLRERRLWPLAVALLVGIVAVPLVLAKSPTSPPPTSPPPARTQGAGTGPVVPPVSVETELVHHQLLSRVHDPFAAQSPITGTAGTTAGRGTNGGTIAALLLGKTGTGATSGSTGSTGASTGGGSSQGSAGTTPAPSPSKPPAPPAPPAPAGLTATQAYTVAISEPGADGGLVMIDPVTRLSVLPSGSTPLLVELGVLQGGSRVLFAVRPGTAVNGPGSCTPGPLDCEVLALSMDQLETATGSSQQGSLSFVVSDIQAQDYPTAAAADAARRAQSALGAQLIAQDAEPALSLFPYDPMRGVLIDQRDLSVGGG